MSSKKAVAAIRSGTEFEDESRGPIRMLKKAIMMGHSTGHRVSHYETAGTVVKSYTEPMKAASAS
jgi:hypothetical protein